MHERRRNLEFRRESYDADGDALGSDLSRGHVHVHVRDGMMTHDAVSSTDTAAQQFYKQPYLIGKNSLTPRNKIHSTIIRSRMYVVNIVGQFLPVAQQQTESQADTASEGKSA